MQQHKTHSNICTLVQAVCTKTVEQGVNFVCDAFSTTYISTARGILMAIFTFQQNTRNKTPPPPFLSIISQKIDFNCKSKIAPATKFFLFNQKSTPKTQKDSRDSERERERRREVWQEYCEQSQSHPCIISEFLLISLLWIISE